MFIYFQHQHCVNLPRFCFKSSLRIWQGCFPACPTLRNNTKTGSANKSTAFIVTRRVRSLKYRCIRLSIVGVRRRRVLCCLMWWPVVAGVTPPWLLSFIHVQHLLGPHPGGHCTVAPHRCPQRVLIVLIIKCKSRGFCRKCLRLFERN
ncbi:unnamed protein product [Ixodes pacificus]